MYDVSIADFNELGLRNKSTQHIDAKSLCPMGAFVSRTGMPNGSPIPAQWFTACLRAFPGVHDLVSHRCARVIGLRSPGVPGPLAFAGTRVTDPTLRPRLICICDPCIGRIDAKRGCQRDEMVLLFYQDVAETFGNRKFIQFEIGRAHV